MDEFLEKIKEILESEVSILIENVDDVVSLLKERGSSKKKIVDDRWKSLNKITVPLSLDCVSKTSCIQGIEMNYIDKIKFIITL